MRQQPPSLSDFKKRKRRSQRVRIFRVIVYVLRLVYERTIRIIIIIFIGLIFLFAKQVATEVKHQNFVQQVEKATIQRDLGSMRSDLDSVQQRVEDQGSEIQSIQAEQRECKKEIKLIKSEMEKIQADLKQSDTKLVVIDSKLKNLEETIKVTRAEDQASLEKFKLDMKKRLVSLESSGSEMKSQLEDCNKDIKKQTRELHTIREKMVEQDQNINRINLILADTKYGLELTVSDLGLVKDELMDLKKSNNILKKQNVRLEEEVQEQKATQTYSLGNFAYIQTESEKLLSTNQQDIKNNVDRIERLETKVLNLEKDKKSLEKTISSSIQELDSALGVKEKLDSEQQTKENQLSTNKKAAESYTNLLDQNNKNIRLLESETSGNDVQRSLLVKEREAEARNYQNLLKKLDNLE